MKHISLLLAAVLLLAACGQPTDSPVIEENSDTYASWASFGDEVIIEDDVLTAADLVENPGLYHDQIVRVEGEIASICRSRGCWLQLDNPDGEPLRVHVPRDEETGEYLWTFPTTLALTDIVIEGLAQTDTLSVERQRHYLEHENATQEELDAITEPILTTHLVVHGALLAEVLEEAPEAEESSEEDAHAHDHADHG